MPKKKSNKPIKLANKIESMKSKKAKNRKKIVPIKRAKKGSAKAKAGVVRFEDLQQDKIKKQLVEFVKALVKLQKEKAKKSTRGSALRKKSTESKPMSKTVSSKNLPSKNMPRKASNSATLNYSGRSGKGSAELKASAKGPNQTGTGGNARPKRKSKGKKRPGLSLVKK